MYSDKNLQLLYTLKTSWNALVLLCQCASRINNRKKHFQLSSYKQNNEKCVVAQVHLDQDQVLLKYLQFTPDICRYAYNVRLLICTDVLLCFFIIKISTATAV